MAIKLETAIIGASEQIGQRSGLDSSEYLVLQTARLFKVGNELTKDPTSLEKGRNYTLAMIDYMQEFDADFNQVVTNLFYYKQMRLKNDKDSREE